MNKTFWFSTAVAVIFGGLLTTGLDHWFPRLVALVVVLAASALAVLSKGEEDMANVLDGSNERPDDVTELYFFNQSNSQEEKICRGR